MLHAVFTSSVDEITVHGLTQWDKGQQLQIALSSLPASFEVHFANKRAETAYVVDAVASNGVAVVDIPNAILRNPVDAIAWIYLVNGEAGETVKTIHLPIERRAKPADYVYEEAEVANFREIVNQRIDEYFESGVIVPGATVEEVTKIKEFTIDQVEFEHTGDLVQFDAFGGCPLNCVTHIEPAQAGSGEPSPSNIRPISGHTGAKLTRVGKNLLPNTATTKTENGVTFTINSDGSVTVNGTATATAFCAIGSVDFKANTKYVLTAGKSVSGAYVKIDTVNIIASSGIAEYTPSADATYSVTLRIGGGTTWTNVTFYPMIRLASVTDATYEPYQGETFSASFDQTVYGGTLDWNTGVLTVDRAVESLTSSKVNSVTDAGTSTQMFVVGINNASFDGHTINDAPVSSHYKGVKWYSNPWNVNNSISYYSQYNLRVRDSRFGSISDYDAYIDAQSAAGTPVQICYKLKTPTTIQLTPAQLTALQGMNNIFCDAGETTVSGRKDILWLTDYLLKRVKELESAVATLETAAVNNV